MGGALPSNSVKYLHTMWKLLLKLLCQQKPLLHIVLYIYSQEYVETVLLCIEIFRLKASLLHNTFIFNACATQRRALVKRKIVCRQCVNR